MQEKLRPVTDKYKGRVLVKGIESIFCIYFTGLDNITSVDQVRGCDMKFFAAFHREMLKRGIYLSPSGYEVGFLSSAHSAEDIDKTVKSIDESLGIVLG